MLYQYVHGDKPLDGYTIKRGLGTGGFGEVYFAQSDSGKEVALKHIQKNLEVELRGVRQCLNLRHPNLVGIYDIRHDQEGRGWIIMEFIQGHTLREVLDGAHQGIWVDRAIPLFAQMVAGCIYLHDSGIVHRDLKPANIFVENSVAKIGDYGLAKFISASRRAGQTETIGTLHYMAPEIAKGQYGKEIDIYSLGIILYEMLTGTVPFEGQSAGEVLMKHLTADPDLSKLPEAYVHVVRKALTKNPLDRYQDGRDLLRDLGYSLDPGGYAVPTICREPAIQVHIEAQPKSIHAKVAQLVDRSKKRLAKEFSFKPLTQIELVPGQQQARELRSIQRQQLSHQGRLSRVYRATRAMMFAGLIISLGTVAGGYLMMSNTEFSNEDWLGGIAWLGVMSTLTSWVVILLSRRWETKTEFPIIFRFSMLAAGLMLGLASYQISEYLMVPCDRISGSHLPVASTSYVSLDPATYALVTELSEYKFNSSWKGFYQANGAPLVGAHMAFFAVLMWSVRWWRLSDSLRKSYFEVLPIVLAFLITSVIECVFYFPIGWAWLLACAVSTVVQLASPWLEPMKTLASIAEKHEP